MEKKSLTENEKLASELCWGCIPLDKDYIRKQENFKQMLVRVEKGEFDYLK